MIKHINSLKLFDLDYCAIKVFIFLMAFIIAKDTCSQNETQRTKTTTSSNDINATNSTVDQQVMTISDNANTGLYNDHALKKINSLKDSSVFVANSHQTKEERRGQIRLFYEQQKTPLLNANDEAFLVSDIIWQRFYGEKEYFLSPKVLNIHEYHKRITSLDSKSTDVHKSKFHMLYVDVNAYSKSLLINMGIDIPDYVSSKVLVLLPEIDIDILNQKNIKYTIETNYGANKDSYSSSPDNTRSTIWEEEFEDSFPGSSYPVGDDNSVNGEDYWDDEDCDYYPASADECIWCADMGGEPNCQNYDDYMDAYVYNGSGIDVGGYSDLKYYYARKYDTEQGYDYLKRYYSSDGSTWTLAQSYDGYADWTYVSTNLTGGWSMFYWQFRFQSDISNNNYYGASLDHMKVTGDAAGEPNLTRVSGNSSLTVTGTTVDISVTVINDGGSSAGSSHLGYYLSENTTFNSSDDYLIGTDYVSSLSPQETSNESISVDVSTISPAIPPGTYYVIYYIDHEGEVSESNESDNIWLWSSPTVTISAPDPNLTRVSGNSSLTVTGTTVDISVTVINDGGSSAGSSHLGYYLSENTTFNSSDDYLIGTDYVSSLSPQETSNESISVDVSTISPAIPPGTYYVIYYIDHEGEVSESNESDNIWLWSSPTVTISAPDPNLTRVSGNSSLTVTGTTVDISVTVINDGGSSAGSSHLGYYLSENTTFNSSDDYLIGTDYVSSLSPQETSNESISVDVSTISPAIPPGTYYVIYYIDHEGEVSESNESDNIWYWSSPTVTIDDPGPTDPYEPNNSFTEATSMSIEFNIGDAYINPTGDDDYFKIPISGYGVITINLTNLPNDYDLYFYDPNLNQLSYSASGGTNSEQIIFSNFTASGYYYVRVMGYSGAYSSSDSYTLQTTWTPAGEPDINVSPSSLTIQQSGSGKSVNRIISPYDTKYKPINTKYVIDTIVDNGDTVVGVVVPYITPRKEPIAYPTRSAVMLSNVPAFSWCFGCSATSAAMAAGYYDNNGYPNMYTGPTNGGVCPLDNSSWPDVVISGETRDQCPLSATHDGLDGRTTRGHVDDYWIVSDNAGPDPWIANGWTQHSWESCTADYMGTSQSTYENVDGGTTFYFSPNGSPLYDYTGCEPGRIDGCHGLREFFESRGYDVVNNYSQRIYGYNGNTQGFTLSQYRAEIDEGRAVLIHVVGHTMLGVGYESGSSDIIYLHNTWDYSLHSMSWGGSYSGMQHSGMTVVELAPAPATGDYFTIENLGNADLSVTSISDNKNWLTVSGYPTAPFTITPNSSQQINVSIDWTLVGSNAQTGTITINSDDPDEATVNVSVTAMPSSQTLTVTPSNQNVSAASGSTTFSILSNTSWTISDNASWLSVSPTTGDNNETITASFNSNSGAQRICTITVSGNGVPAVNVTVTQAAYTPAPYLTVTPANQNVNSTEGSTSFTVSSNVTWNVSDDATWLTVSPTSGSNNNTIVASYAANTNNSQRIGTITIIGNGVPNEVITVTQEGDSSPNGHFVPIWIGNPYNTMSITVTLATLDAVDLLADDEIGVFDGDVCVGAAVLHQIINPNNASTHLYITCSKDDPGTPEQDGYIEGHDISYRLWDQDQLFEAQQVNVIFPYPSFAFGAFAQGETAIVQLNGMSSITQLHNLSSGWNLISWNVVPGDVDIQNILQSIIDEGKLMKVIDENGDILQHMPWGWVNNIGDMANTEGYQVKTSGECTFSTDGSAVALPIDIPMMNGWNQMGWPAQSPEDAETAFAALISSGTLVKVVDESGNILQHMPWGWVNNIGNLLPGEGYQVKVSSGCNLVVNEPSSGGKALKADTPQAILFRPQSIGNPYNPMAFAIQLNNNLPNGAELAVFEGDRCLGAAVVAGEYLYLSAGMDEAETTEIEGFTEGGDFSFRYRTAEMSQSEMLSIAYLEGDKTFAERGTFVGELKEATGNNEYGLNELRLFQNQPNPFHEYSQIGFDLPENGNVKLEIIGLSGKTIRVLHEGELNAGRHNKEINAANWPAGMYYCRLSFIRGNEVQIKVKRILIY